MLQAPNKIRVAVPSEGPLLNPILMCPTCGQLVLPTLTRIANGRISGITFYHTNEEYGCAWKTVYPMTRTNGETTGLAKNVRMGVDDKGQPKLVDEADLAVGTSFDAEGLKPQEFPNYSIGIDMAEGADKAVAAILDTKTGEAREISIKDVTRAAESAVNNKKPLKPKPVPKTKANHHESKSNSETAEAGKAEESDGEGQTRQAD